MESKLQHTSATPTDFNFPLLQQITNNFSEENRIGVGGYGVVYKGTLDNGEVIAVKKLYYKNPGVDSDKQFQNECTNLMMVRHENIVRLVGYCHEIHHKCVEHNGRYVLAMIEDRALCFEYLEGGSLDKHLSDESCGFGWHTRYKIIKGICEALNYLHNGLKEPIFHLDLKPANILLDRNMMPKIGDFGLSRLFNSTETYSTKGIIGTPGYMPPEYIDRSQITAKFDVFSLGVTIIKIMAGHEGYSKFADMSSQDFVQLVHENWEKALRTTVLSHTLHGVKKCIEIALRCVEADRVKRPTVAEVVDELSKIDTTIIDELNKIDTTRSSPTEQVTNLRSKQAFDPCMNLESPKLQSPSERTEKDDSQLPSNPTEVEALRNDSVRKNPLIAFTFEELKRITRNFRQDSVLGGGGFGRVYKGCATCDLREGLAIKEPLRVAVKVHDGDVSFQGHREWLAEVIFLGQLSHPNLVKLVGYCCEDDHRVLVYELMPLGSVESHLFSRVMQPLPWATRMKIALGAARGLAFLHEAEKPVIYRDFKTSNILLDEEYHAKLSDFGLAKDGPVGDKSHVSTRIMGTYGYAAPEYIMTGHLTAMSDVYSYGVVLLELLTGRKSLDRSRPVREQTLADWAFPLLSNRKKVLGIVDPRLAADDYPVKAVHKTAMLAYHCLSRNPKARPLMRDIVATLEPLQQQPPQPEPVVEVNPADDSGGSRDGVGVR